LQKISLSPSVEMFFFQHQAFQQLGLLQSPAYHGYTTSLALNYSFEWHNGVKWNKAFTYSNPVPAQPSLPTK
jgi:hypothetical protein